MKSLKAIPPPTWGVCCLHSRYKQLGSGPTHEGTTCLMDMNGMPPLRVGIMSKTANMYLSNQIMNALPNMIQYAEQIAWAEGG